MSGHDAAVTLINVVEIPADQVDRFVVGWRERAKIMSAQPGFRGYRLHQALLADSRFQLVNVACWDSPEAFQSAMSSAEFRSRIEELEHDTDIAVTGNPALYRVVDSSGLLD